MKISEIFGIRRDERWIALLALVFMVALNALMVNYNYDLFTRGGNLGYHGIFTRNYELSGYDILVCVTLSRWKIMHALYRHPLLSAFMYPFAKLNEWQMQYTETNMAIFIVAAVLVFCGVYSFLFMHRIMREVMGLGRGDSLMFTLMFCSFGHVMVGSFAPDHFGVSMFLLMLTLYVAGKSLRGGRPMGRWTTMLLFIMTAGVTLTNGVKTMLAALWCGGRRFFARRHMLVAVILPVAFLGAAYCLQYYKLVLPEKKMDRLRTEQRAKVDKKYAEEIRKGEAWNRKRAKKQIVDNPLFEWTDNTTSRIDAVWENVFGESVQLHSSYLLKDVNKTRPDSVDYDWTLNYVVEVLVVLLFLGGIWCGRRDRFLHLGLSWFAFDMFLHLALGFGILEVYIMTVHWIFIIPIAMAALLRASSARPRRVLRGVLWGLTGFLLIYNGSLVASYMLNL